MTRIKILFGTLLAVIYTIEFQKGGLPHVLILITLANKDNFRDAETIVLAVWADIPSQNQYTDLHEIVKKHMIHLSCGPESKLIMYGGNAPSLSLKRFLKKIGKI